VLRGSFQQEFADARQEVSQGQEKCPGAEVTIEGAIMRFPAVFLVMVLLAIQTVIRDTPGAPQDGTRTNAHASELDLKVRDSAMHFLLNAAATDFHAHGPTGPLRFRGVRLGHLTTTAARPQYRLCGQFMGARERVDSQWTPFATIKTSGYEQWIGGQAVVFCRDSSIIWDDVGDLSSALESRVDAIR
jgi:hypothetical protein